MQTTIECEISFNTPAILGDAQQNSVWRTPPIKNALRTMWRIHYARQNKSIDLNDMRLKEGELFGQVSSKPGNKSRVLIRLDNWAAGKEDGKSIVKSKPYLAYGLKDTTTKFIPKIIPAEDSNRLRILVTQENYIDEINDVIKLVGQFSTLGAKSRNGFGSLNIKDNQFALTKQQVAAYARHIDDCLQLNWPHAVGSDNDGLLIWRTAPNDDVNELLGFYQTLKKNYRNAVKEMPGKDQRFILALPLKTGGDYKNESDRLSSQIVYKVLKEGNQYVGQVTHFPAAFPSEHMKDKPDAQSQLKVWNTVHAAIDNDANFKRW